MYFSVDGFSARKNLYIQFLISSFGFGYCLLHCIGSGKDDAHSTMSLDFGFAENTDLHSRLFKRFLKIAEQHFISIAFNNNGT